MRKLRRKQTLTFRRTAREAFRLGIRRGIDKLATHMFTLWTPTPWIPANDHLVLTGDVYRELAEKAKQDAREAG